MTEKSRDFLTRPDDDPVALRRTIATLISDNAWLKAQQQLLTEKLIVAMDDNRRLQWIINGRMEGYDFERLLKDD